MCHCFCVTVCVCARVCSCSLAGVYGMDAFEQLLGEAKCYECGKVGVVECLCVRFMCCV